MPLYTVTCKIRSGNIDSGEPVNVGWYEGENLALAIAAMAQAAASAEQPNENLPERMRVRVLDVYLAVREADESDPEAARLGRCRLPAHRVAHIYNAGSCIGWEPVS